MAVLWGRQERRVVGMAGVWRGAVREGDECGEDVRGWARMSALHCAFIALFFLSGSNPLSVSPTYLHLLLFTPLPFLLPLLPPFPAPSSPLRIIGRRVREVDTRHLCFLVLLGPAVLFIGWGNIGGRAAVEVSRCAFLTCVLHSVTQQRIH